LAFAAFVRNPVGWSGIYVSGPAKAGPRRVARPSRVVDHLVGPAWSADGRWIAFTNDSENGSSQVWLVRDDGTAQRRLTAGNADSDPVWAVNDLLTFTK
jgi:Tol biopolymer transport system component